jgi:hypothetical protein
MVRPDRADRIEILGGFTLAALTVGSFGYTWVQAWQVLL